MIGRIVGTLVGAATALVGYGMLKPALFVKWFDFGKLSLGPFDAYRTIVCGLIVAFGAVVVLASLQRPTGVRKKRPAPIAFAPAEAEPARSPMTLPLMDPEPDAQADHAADQDEDHDEERRDHQAEAEVQAHEPAH